MNNSGIARKYDRGWQERSSILDRRDIKAYIAMHRSSSAPFDLVVGGHTPGDDPAKARAQVEQFVEAGATWWSEFVLPGPGEADRALTRIKQGPPLRW